MNESIDLLFLGAKAITCRNNTASLVIHGLSASYNIAQMGHYRFLYYSELSALDLGRMTRSMTQIDYTLVEQYQREMIKHTILAGLDLLVFFTGWYSIS